MMYAVLIHDAQGNDVWTAKYANTPTLAASAVWHTIKAEHALVVSDQRPSGAADHDGMPAIYNPAHVVNVVAFPAT